MASLATSNRFGTKGGWGGASAVPAAKAETQIRFGHGSDTNIPSIPPDDHPRTEEGRADQKGDLAPGSPVGEYIVEERVGEGAMGSVYRAYHPVLRKRAAIKVMRSFLAGDPDAIQRFITEARAIARVRHPNIVDAFSFGTLPDGRCFLGMEWLEGETLNARLKRGPLELKESLQLLQKICLALEAAHAVGIVHRDLKPDNVFLAKNGATTEVKLLDFSIAKLLEAGRPTLTRTGVLLGTPAYMAPEQIMGKNIGPPVDVYAMGVLAYRGLAGKLPFRSDNAVELVQLHCNALPPPLVASRKEVSPALASLVGAMMDKDPSKRPSVASVKAKLESMLHELEEPDITALVPEDRQPRHNYVGLMAMFLIVAAVVATIIALIAYWPTRNTPPTVAAPEPPPPTPAPLIQPINRPNRPISLAPRAVQEQEPEPEPEPVAEQVEPRRARGRSAAPKAVAPVPKTSSKKASRESKPSDKDDFEFIEPYAE